MSKKEFNKYAKNQRIYGYKDCQQCGGSPPTVECNLQGLIFNRCDLCDNLVGDYRKEGAPIKVKEIPSRFSHNNINPETSVVKDDFGTTGKVINPEGEIVPGVLPNTFGKLKIV